MVVEVRSTDHEVNKCLNISNIPWNFLFYKFLLSHFIWHFLLHVCHEDMSLDDKNQNVDCFMFHTHVNVYAFFRQTFHGLMYKFALFKTFCWQVIINYYSPVLKEHNFMYDGGNKILSFDKKFDLLPFKNIQKTSTPCILSVVYRWRKIVLPMGLWF